MNRSLNDRNRVFWLDAARSLAIIAITINHAVTRSFSIYNNSHQEFINMGLGGNILKTVLYIFSRIGVPMFLMISGAILFQRNYEVPEVRRRFVKHNWYLLFRTTMIWLAIMFWFLELTFNTLPYRNGDYKKTIADFVQTMLGANQITMGSMWYMPMILVVYLMIPVISTALKRIGDRYFVILFAFVALTSMVIPTINRALLLNGSSYHIEYVYKASDAFSMYFLYVLAGHWINDRRLDIFKTSVIVVWGLLSFAAVVSFQLWSFSVPNDYAIVYADIGILSLSAAVFELIRRYAEKIRYGRRQITHISMISFGIYFLHICVMICIDSSLNDRFTGFGKVIILVLGSFFLSVLLIWALSRIRFCKKYLFLIKDQKSQCVDNDLDHRSFISKKRSRLRFWGK